MKKLVTAACALAAVSAMAVDSANTVGYTTRSAAADTFIVLGAQFEDISSTAANAVDANINDIVSGTFTPSEYDMGGDFTDTAPLIKTWVYDQSISGWTYESYYYINGAWDTINNQEVTGWANGGGDLVTATLPAGAAMWFKSGNACSVTFRGNVPGAAVQLEADNGEFVFVCNPMPVDFDLNDASITWSGIVPSEYDMGGNFTDTAPLIKAWVYDSSISGWTYASYYYINGAWDTVNNQEVTGWANGGGDLSADIIPVAYGFWFKPTSDVTATFVSPIAANN